MKKYISLITKSRLFAGMTEEEVLSMLKCLSATEKTFGRGEHIYTAGDTISCVAMLLEGSVHIEREDYWGNNSIISYIEEGELFGEVYALLDREPILVNAVAAKECKVLMMDIEKIFAACQNTCPHHAGLIHNFVYVLAARNKALTVKMGYLSQRQIRDKLMTYLSEQSLIHGSSSFNIPFNRQQMADFLSVDRSAMSRELGKLKDEGILEFHKNHFVLKEKNQ